MRGRIISLLAGLLLAAGWNSAAASASGVAVHASVGFNNVYRDGPQWVPIHARVTNTGASFLAGEITARGNTAASATYTQPVSLYPGTTKVSTLYVPATGVGNDVTVTYMVGGRRMGQAVAYPEAIPDGDLLLGALTDDPSTISWLRSAAPAGTHLHLVALSADTLPSAPEALLGLDALVLTNLDTSQLDSGQIDALRGYVHEGGSLLLVGGASWQSTLGGLPSDLVPGRPAGFRTIQSLPARRLLGSASTPHGRLGAAPLASPRGVVLIPAGNEALVVKQPLGDGLVDYLGFDPSQSPLSRWAGLPGLSRAILADVMPQSLRRLPLDPADRSTSYLFPGSQPMALGTELANVPAPAIAVLLGLLVVGVVAIIFVVAVPLLVRRMRPRLAPFAAALAILIAAGTLVRAAPAYAESRTIVNTISFVQLDGNGPQYPATVYAGLIAPLAGTYRLDYPAPALATNLSASYPGPYWNGGTVVSEGPSTEIDLGRMGYWSARAVSLHTTVALRGGVVTSVGLTRRGDIAGRIYNRTDTVLREPVLIAGRTDARLPDIPPHASVPVTLAPAADPQEHDYVPMLTRIYGRPRIAGNGLSSVSPFGNPTDMPREKSMADRIRDAVDTLPETNLVSILGEVTFVAWTDAPIAPFTVNGAHVQERDLSMLVKAVPTLSPPSGRFQIQNGTIGGRMLSVSPVPAAYTCCGPTAQPISFGRGGSATFAFTLPIHTGVSSMRLDVYAGGSDPEASGYEGLPAGTVSVYDWRSGRWTPLSAHNGIARPVNPDRLVSPSGAVLVRIVAKRGDLSILDAHQDIQLAVTGTRR